MRGPMQDLGEGPSEQWFHVVIVFSQSYYGRGWDMQICSAALTRELRTFANVREEFYWFWRERCLLTMKFPCRFYWILKRKVYLAKMNNLPKHHGAGPQRGEAQCSCIGCIGLRPALRGADHAGQVMPAYTAPAYGFLWLVTDYGFDNGF